MMKRSIPVSHPILDGNEKKYVNDCLDSGWISSIGPYIQKFEQAFANYLNTDDAISCCNGTAALHLALMALNVKPNDEIILPTLTYVATANSVVYCGAKPIFVDSAPKTGNIDPHQIIEKITPKTKGIIVVHLYGHPVDMDLILEIATKYNLFVLEDAAQALGAYYKNHLIGTLGDIGVFSFFGNKIMTTGEGGMLVTRDRALANKIRILKGQGMDPNKRYWFTEVGYNYRMTNIQAAIGLAQLEKIVELLQYRRSIVKSYQTHLKHLQDKIHLPEEDSQVQHSYWMYTIFLRKGTIFHRDAIMKSLAEDGIETRPVFYPMHTLPHHVVEGQFPIAESLSKRGINLPTHNKLNEEDIQYISNRLSHHLNKLDWTQPSEKEF